MTATLAILVALVWACIYLGKKTLDMRAENADLRVQVLSLKRQLARTRS